MNLAVVFTEYQLIQVQALVNYYNIKGIFLIIIDNNRIQDWLIDRGILKKLIRYNDTEISRNKRIYKKYILQNYNRISDILEGYEIEIMIGAQDENTLFSIFKKIAKPNQYWSIEDGIANYYERDLKFKTGILFKRLLFKIIYGYDLKIEYNHGLEESDKSFRMAPEIANKKNNNVIELAPIVKKYLTKKAKEVSFNKKILTDYEQFHRLVITDLKHYKKSMVVNNSKSDKSILYKFHPSDKVPHDIGVNYMDEKIPLELVPFLLKNLQFIEFQVMSSSFLNLKKMNLDLKVIDNIDRDTKINRYFLSKYDMYFDNK